MLRTRSGPEIPFVAGSVGIVYSIRKEPREVSDNAFFAVKLLTVYCSGSIRSPVILMDVDGQNYFYALSFRLKIVPPPFRLPYTFQLRPRHRKPLLLDPVACFASFWLCVVPPLVLHRRM